MSGPTSILGEPIPAGILNPACRLCVPPARIGAAEILPANLPDAWKEDKASGLSVATALSIKSNRTYPWKTVRDVISDALHARFLELDAGSPKWPCDFPSAQFVTLKLPMTYLESGKSPSVTHVSSSKVLVAEADLEPSQVQDLGDVIPKLLDVKSKYNTPIRFKVRIEVGDERTIPAADITQRVNAILKEINENMQLSND